jgi:hypothetical protein
MGRVLINSALNSAFLSASLVTIVTLPGRLIAFFGSLNRRPLFWLQVLQHQIWYLDQSRPNRSDHRSNGSAAPDHRRLDPRRLLD